MTRKYIFLFITALIISFSLLYGIFGIKGVVVNRALERQLTVGKELLKVQETQVEALERLYEGVWERESLLEKSKRSGYAQKGEVVYYFFDSQGEAIIERFERGEEVVASPPPKSHFKGLSTPLLALISFGLVSVVTLLIRVISSRRKRWTKLDYSYGYW